MSLEKIRQAVLTEARTEADNILEDARKKVSAALHTQKERIERDSERHYNISIQVIEDEYRRKLLQYKGFLSKQILEKRNLILGAIFKKAEEAILGLPAEEYGRFMAGLVNTVSGSTGGKLHIHHDERDIFLKILPEINKTRSPEKKIVLDESHPLSERGGFVFASAEYEVDQTLRTMFNDIEKEMLPVIAKELFSVSEV